jgi:hypothetical protein
MKTHYSIFRAVDTSGDVIYLDLAAIAQIEYQQNPGNVLCVVTLASGKSFSTTERDADAIVTAWNAYKATVAAAPFIQAIAHTHSEFSTKSAVRNSQYLWELIMGEFLV